MLSHTKFLAILSLMALPEMAMAVTGQIGNSALQLQFEIPASAESYKGTRFD